jgi:uncharacterized membrane protein (DUF4010 family)
MQMPQIPSVTLNTFPLSMTAFLQLIASGSMTVACFVADQRRIVHREAFTRSVKIQHIKFPVRSFMDIAIVHIAALGKLITGLLNTAPAAYIALAIFIITHSNHCAVRFKTNGMTTTCR